MSSSSKFATDKNQRVLIELVNQPGNGETTHASPERLLTVALPRCLCRLQSEGPAMGLAQFGNLHMVRPFQLYSTLSSANPRGQCQLCEHTQEDRHSYYQSVRHLRQLSRPSLTIFALGRVLRWTHGPRSKSKSASISSWLSPSIC